MPRPPSRTELPYLDTFTRKGKLYTYYRRQGQRVPIEGKFGTPEWLANYQRIHASFEQPSPQDKAKAGSFAALIEAYLASPEFTQLSDKSRRDYRRYIDQLKKKYGNLPVRTMPRAFVFKVRDKYGDKPRTANYMVQMIRRLMSFAVDHGWRPDNPAARPKQLRTGGGHRPWEEHEVEAFRKKHAPKTFERVAFELLLYTGQRGGDVVKMKRHQISENWVRVTQEKTKELVEIPLAQKLEEVLMPYLEATRLLKDGVERHHSSPVLVGDKGKGVGVDAFRHRMREAYRKAGLPDTCTTHGLRYTAATRLHELGCDWTIVAAITGHATMEMARKYSEKRRKAALAIRRLNQAEGGEE